MQRPLNSLRYLFGRLTEAEYRYKQIPVDFERKTGTTGIAGDYKFPDNKTAGDYDLWSGIFYGPRNGDGKRQTSLLQAEWAKLVKLNPSLEIIQVENDPSNIRDAINGTATLFNTDDINYYIELRKRTKCDALSLLSHMIPEYSDLVHNIESRIGVRLIWVAAPSTLVSIYEQVKDRPYSLQERSCRVDESPEYYDEKLNLKRITPEEVEAARSFMNLPSLTL